MADEKRSIAAKKAAQTRKRKAAGKKAAETKKRRAAGKKAAQTKKRRAAGKKAALTKKRRAAGKKAAETRKRRLVTAEIPKKDLRTFDDWLDHHVTKCRIHLARTMALHQVFQEPPHEHSAEVTEVGKLYRDILRELAHRDKNLGEPDKLQKDLTTQALTNLKTDFQYFANRVARVWTKYHLDVTLERLEQIPKNPWQSRLNGVAPRRKGERSLRDDDSLNEFLDKLVPGGGLPNIQRYLGHSSELKLASLEAKTQHQILVAFQVRNKYEHTNGKVDSKFVEDVEKIIGDTSWADWWKRMPDDPVGEKIPVRPKDVKHTYNEMVNAVDWLDEELRRSDSKQSR